MTPIQRAQEERVKAELREVRKLLAHTLVRVQQMPPSLALRKLHALRNAADPGRRSSRLPS